MSNLKRRPEFKIPQSVRNKFKKKISGIRLEVSAKEVDFKVVHYDETRDWGYEINFAPHLEKHVAIKATTNAGGVLSELSNEFVDQGYIPAALDHLKSVFKGFEAKTEVYEFQVIVDNELETDKQLFFTTLRNHFAGMGNKKLNVEMFAMKYSGDEEDEEELMTFLRHIKLIKIKQLTLESIRPNRKELCLERTFELQTWKDARVLLLEGDTWMDWPVDEWVHFTTSEVGIWKMNLETVQKIVTKANTTADFISCEIKPVDHSRPDGVQTWLSAHFDTAFDAENANFGREFKVTLINDKWTFGATGPLMKDPLEGVDHLYSVKLLLIYLTPERAVFNVADVDYLIYERFIPMKGSGCRSIRKAISNYAFSFEYTFHKKANYMTKLLEMFRMFLKITTRRTKVTEYRVAVGCKEADVESFEKKKDLFLKLIKTDCRKAQNDNIGKLRVGFIQGCFSVRKFVIEYGGDEDVAFAFLSFIELIRPQEVHFRPHPLDNRVKPFLLTYQKEKGVLWLPEWKQVKKFVMYAPFYSQIPMDTLLEIPESKIVMQWINMVFVSNILPLIRSSDTFISCQIETHVPNQNLEIFRLIRASFQHKNKTETEFRDLKGLEVLLDKNVYIFKAPPKEVLDPRYNFENDEPL